MRMRTTAPRSLGNPYAVTEERQPDGTREANLIWGPEKRVNKAPHFQVGPRSGCEEATRSWKGGRGRERGEETSW